MNMENIARIVRGLAADAVEKANSGHPGLPLGCAEIGSQLFFSELQHNPTNPSWPNRDRFVLSAGHGSMLLYSLLHLTGYDVTLEDLKEFRQLNSKTPGHPEYGHTPGVETTTGPLGQGIGNAVGMAIAERMMAERFNTDTHTIVDHFTYALSGDGCMMEGVSSEAASLAGHLQLSKLILFYDSNEITIEGRTDLAFSESVAKRFEAYNWHVQKIDGHSFEEVAKAVAAAKADERPSLIVADTTIGKGAPNKQDTAGVHGSPLGAEELKAFKETIGLPQEAFFIADDVKEAGQSVKTRGQELEAQWERIFEEWAEENPKLAEQWRIYWSLELPANLEEILPEYAVGSSSATRNSGGEILNALANVIPNLVGGSADLAPSTKTHLKGYSNITKDDFSGRNFNFGVREHGMGAVVNGMALYGGLRPFGSTFLVFSDYMRPAIRLSALMKLPVIHVFTHDSIFVGEDGPTHQPVEHAEALRVIPNLNVYRPADAQETAQCWLSALRYGDGPSAILLTRQDLPVFSKPEGWSVERGAYVVADTDEPQLILAASGSEVSLAVETADRLTEQGIAVRVVSVPCRELFVKQEKAYRQSVFSPDTPIFVLDVGVSFGWYSLAPGERMSMLTLDDFGVCGPGAEVASYLGFNVDNAVAKAKELLA